MWGYMAYYVPPSKKVGRHVPRVLHQIAPMSTVNFLSTNYVLSLTILITSKLSFLRFLLPQLQPPLRKILAAPLVVFRGARLQVGRLSETKGDALA